MHIHQITKFRIRRHFTRGLSAGEQKRLFRKLDDCTECARTYRQYSALEVALGGDSRGISPVVVDRIESVLFESLGAPSQHDGIVSRKFSQARWVPVWSGIAAVLALGVFLILSQGAAPPHRVPLGADSSLIAAQIQARGGSGSMSQQFGIRVFVVVEADDRVGESDGVGIDDVITFTYTRAVEGSGYLTLFGLQDSDELLWYFPDYGQTQSIKIEGDVVDQPLGTGIDLSVNHQPGTLHLVALFTDEPLTVEVVEAKLQNLQSQGVGISEIPTQLLVGFGTNSAGYLLELGVDGYEKSLKR